MLFLYNVFIVLLLPVLFLRLVIKAKDDVQYISCIWERVGLYFEAPPCRVWVHAVSVGEVVAATALIDRLLRKYPQDKIIVSVMTPTGKSRLRKIYQHEPRIHCCFLPYDVSFFMKSFIKKFQPEILIIMETEIWPSMLNVTHNANIPIILANARMSAKSCRKYAKFRSLSKFALSNIDIIAAQYPYDAKRFAFLLGGSKKNIVTLGSVKYDLLPNPKETAIEDRLTFIASCTHPGEEEHIFAAYKVLKQEFKDLRLIMAPRHVHRCDDLSKMLQEYMPDMTYGYYSKQGIGNVDVVFVDKIGVLDSCYNQSNIVFIGGSLVERGAQSPLEAASLGKPILIGPSTYNFKAIVQDLAKSGGLISIHDADSIAKEVAKMLLDPTLIAEIGIAAANHVAANQGAADLHMQYITDFLQE